MMTIPDHLVAVLLILVWPGYGFMTHARALRAIANDVSGRERIKTYRRMMAREWAAAILVILVWLASGRPWADLGLGAPGGRGFLIGIALPVAAAAFFFTQLVSLSKNAALRADFQTKVAGGAFAFLPRTDEETANFSWLAVSAGVCEEIAYRGFLIWYLAAAFGMPLGAGLSAVIFGVAHAYQGPSGILKTGIVGLILAGLYLLSGSLWLSILLHATIDLSMALAAKLAFAPPPVSAAITPSGSPGQSPP
jgi:uncharacterized protein